MLLTASDSVSLNNSHNLGTTFSQALYFSFLFTSIEEETFHAIRKSKESPQRNMTDAATLFEGIEEKAQRLKRRNTF